MLVALAAAGCGDSAAVVVPPTAPTGRAPARAPGTGPAVPSNYAGLGTASAVFARSHRESPRGRGPGVPLVSGVTAGPGGRVTGYDVEFNDRPPLSDFERIVAAAAISDLPRDRITVSSAPGCLVYGSPSLKRLLGVSYASVTTRPGTRTARVRTRATPGC